MLRKQLANLMVIWLDVESLMLVLWKDYWLEKLTDSALVMWMEFLLETEYLLMEKMKERLMGFLWENG